RCARRGSLRAPAVPGPRQHRRRHRQRVAGAGGAAPHRPVPARSAAGHAACTAEDRQRALPQRQPPGRGRVRAGRAGRGAARGGRPRSRLPAPLRHGTRGAGHGRSRRRRTGPVHPRYPGRRRARGRGSMTEMNATIPTLDIRRFTHASSDADREAFVAELGATYREWGFAGIRGHGIPQALVDEAYDAFRRFFALPDEAKRRYHVPGGGGARGYTPFMVETAKDSRYPDLKEFWHIRREIPRDSRHAADTPPNLWPEEVPGFREAGYGLYTALDDLGSQVLSALALHIGLPADWFADKTDFGNSILRPIHYPPITSPEVPNVRAGAHEDINLITLLVGASAAGLEVHSRKGEWVPFTAAEDTIV